MRKAKDEEQALAGAELHKADISRTIISDTNFNRANFCETKAMRYDISKLLKAQVDTTQMIWMDYYYNSR